MNSSIGICKLISKTFLEDARYYMKRKICKRYEGFSYRRLNKEAATGSAL